MLPPSFPSVAPAKITEEEVEVAARSLGLKTIRVETIKAHRVMGQFIAEIGVAQVARGVYLGSIEQLQGMMKTISAIVDTLANEPAIQANMIKAFSGCAKALNESAKGLMESGDPKPESPLRPSIGLPPAPGGVVIQVNGGQVKIQEHERKSSNPAVYQGVGEQATEE